MSCRPPDPLCGTYNYAANPCSAGHGPASTSEICDGGDGCTDAVCCVPDASCEDFSSRGCDAPADYDASGTCDGACDPDGDKAACCSGGAGEQVDSGDSAEADSEVSACAGELAACEADPACLACNEGGEECAETADATYCAGVAAHLCCMVENMFGCNNNTLLVALKNCEEDDISGCVFTDFCDYADDFDAGSGLFSRSSLDVAVFTGAIAAAVGVAAFLLPSPGMLV